MLTTTLTMKPSVEKGLASHSSISPPDLPMNEIGEVNKKRIKSKINQERVKIKKRARRDLI